MSTLRRVCDRRIPTPSTTRWNFKSRTVATVYENRDKIIECCDELETSLSKETCAGAVGIKQTLQHPEFQFWLQFITPSSAHTAVSLFVSNVQKIRNEIEEPDYAQGESRLHNNKLTADARESCDVIIAQCRERFSFTYHFTAVQLFAASKFPSYQNSFPTAMLTETIKAYPFLDSERLRNELSVLYVRKEMWHENLLDCHKFILEQNLQCTFPNIMKLLQILITTPLTTSEAERCFSTLKRLKTFLRSTMTNQRLTASAMLSIEKTIITEMKDFNSSVIDNFASQKSRRTDFVYK